MDAVLDSSFARITGSLHPILSPAFFLSFCYQTTGLEGPEAASFELTHFC